MAMAMAACGDDAAPSDASVLCAEDAQCDDGVYCNGAEVCAPATEGANSFGCVGTTLPCLDAQRCDETNDRCAAICEVATDADGDGADATDCGGDDCDDADASRYPGATEVCDLEGVDEDCDPSTVGGRDLDGDGYEDAACCNGDNCGDDCADRMATVNPGAAEVCDLVDQDCDGSVDEGVQTAGFEDRDGDRYGDPERPRQACAFDGDVSPSMADCDDADGTRHGQMLEICDGQDNDCDDAVDEERFSVSWYADSDGDGFGDPDGEVRVSCEPIEGFSTLPFDCDDRDPSRSPITPEACNGLDDDCDGRADFQLATGDTEDDDGDGVADARCPGGLGLDCDDRDPFAKPGTPELCDGVDNDCDGTVDEGAAPQLWYVDDDQDGYGDDAAERRASCERLRGLVLRGGDCDDGDDGVRPGVRERCNGLDDDCDGTVDEDAGYVATYTDNDGDGFGTGMPLAQCSVPGLRALTPGDCDDRNPANRPGAPEICDDVDNDCDGSVDEGTRDVVWYPDGDGDGYGDPAGTTVSSCEPVAGHSRVGTDCNDGNANFFPGAPELCDALDNDCDSVSDENAAEGTLQYPDGDGDGYGGGTGVMSCEPLAGHALRAEDCDDSDPLVGPGAAESCNGEDDDCDGMTDEAPAGYVSCGVDSTNATPVCADGLCGYGTCLSGFDDCDGTVVNGCESDLGSDPRNCGACAASCGPGGRCTGGLCQNVPVVSVATAIGVVCAVRNGQVFCWGDERATGTYGGRGDGDLLMGVLDSPSADRPVVGLTDAVDVVAGNDHVCALRAGGEAVCWGENGSNRLGDGSGTIQHVPAAVLGGHRFEELEAATGQTCGRVATGRVYCWGSPVGMPVYAGVQEVVRADGAATAAVDLAVGRGHVCIVGPDARVYCRGSSGTTVGQPAGTSFPDFVGPVRGADDMPLEDVTEIAAGGDSTCARLTDGRVFCWGANGTGALGDGTTTSRGFAAAVTGISDAAGLFVGRGVACAWRTSGALLCWGRNADRQLGDAAFTEPLSTTPRPVPGLSAVTDGSTYVQTQSNFKSAICAVDGGGVACWGPGQGAPPVRIVEFP